MTRSRPRRSSRSRPLAPTQDAFELGVAPSRCARQSDSGASFNGGHSSGWGYAAALAYLAVTFSSSGHDRSGERVVNSLVTAEFHKAYHVLYGADADP